MKQNIKHKNHLFWGEGTSLYSQYTCTINDLVCIIEVHGLSLSHDHDCYYSNFPTEILDCVRSWRLNWSV